MKYFRVNCGDASGMSDFWEYYEFPDSYDIDEARALYAENNPWIYSLDCDRRKSEEITEEQYKTGLIFNTMYEYEHERNEFRELYNLYPSKEMAEMFGNKHHKSGYIRIGYPNTHNVYKVNADGNFIFVYHYCSNILGILPEPSTVC